MSSTVISKGFIAILVNPVPKDQIGDVLDTLYNGDDNFLKITYDGKLLYSDEYERKKYSEREFNGALFIMGSLPAGAGIVDFANEASKVGFLVDPITVQPYTCVWYNGSDCPVSLLSKEKFLAGEVS